MRPGPRASVVLVVVALVGLVCGAAVSYYVSSRTAPHDVAGLLWPPPRQLGDFELTDQYGAPFDATRLLGHWTVMFFGYTNCPDVCPVTLQVMADAARRLDASGDGADLQIVFVSVDPDRDTPERLGAYVRFFDPDFLGVTGAHEALRGLTRQAGVLAVLGEPDADGNYLVDHTAALIVTDPQARLVGVLQAPHEAGAVAESLRGIRRFVEG